MAYSVTSKMPGATKITDFFSTKTNPTAKSTENSTLNSNKITSAAQFYQKSVEIQKHLCKKESCNSLKSALKIELANFEANRRAHEQAIKTCADIISEKDREIDELRKLIDQSQTPNISTPDNSLSFSQFENDFTSAQLVDLRSIGLTSRDDSKFVSFVIKCMYQENLSCLKTKSVTGRSVKQGETKTQISPDKMMLLKNIYSERIMAATEDSFEREKRKKMLNRKVNDAIHNISRRMESNQNEHEVSKRLQFDD